jgi:tetratricopeptide (TPR) repeat protein
MGERGRGAAQAFADALRDLHVKAGAPTYGELIHQGQAQRPPVLLSDASLSDWLNGKSTPARSDVVLFLVAYLQPKAMQRTTYEPRSLNWWEQLRIAAARDRNAGRGGRPRAAMTPNAHRGWPSRPVTNEAGEPLAIEKSTHENQPPKRAMEGGSPALGIRADGVAAATRTLPRDTASFTGREPELRQLVSVAAGTAHFGGVVGIHAIGGMAGIGKTTLAVHAAHQLAPRFPDGQIFLPLHGHTPGQQPVDPADALASLLLTAGVSAAQIPSGLEARTSLWRDRLAGKQLLLVLDDAAGSEQVQPLLPGTAGSLVLVTSRRHLTALEGAQAVSLGTLPPDEAAELLIQLAARPGLEPGDAAVAEITRLCGCLPLAVGMLARQLHHHPAWTAADLAADLAAARDRLELMQAENLSVAAAFDLSYQDLTPGQQQLFRRLGLHPGPDIDAYAAAALDGTDLATARRHLDALYDQYLIAEPARGRYRLHDLIREHARALAAINQRSDNAAATSRLLDYYLHTAAIAEGRLAAQSTTRSRPAAGTSPLATVPGLPDHTQALAWARAERANLLACLDHATHTGQHAQVVALTAAMAALLLNDGPWTNAISRHTTAAQAAQHADDRLGEANALAQLGTVLLKTCDYRAAAQALQEALGICVDLGDRLGEANALSNLGAVRYLTGDYPAATQAAEEALGIYVDLGDRLGEANALSDLGNARCGTSDLPGAAQALQEALGIYVDLGDRLGEAYALANLGSVRQMTGDYEGATEAIEEALRVCVDLGDRLGEAYALSYLGSARRATGDYPGATDALEAALTIYRDLGHRVGEGVALGELGGVRRATGDYPGATDALEAALAIYRDLGDRGGEAEALNEAGTLRRARGSVDRAAVYHQQALALAREIGSAWDEAHALAGLGRCAMAAGRTADAQVGLQQAREIFQRIGAAETTGVTAELNALTETEATAEKD